MQERVDGERHPALGESANFLIPIGYWHSEDSDGLPHPKPGEVARRSRPSEEIIVYSHQSL